MIPLALETIARVIDGKLLRGDPERTVGSISTDTRTLVPGDLFFALVGKRFDGHTFIPQAAARGAAGVVVRDLPAELPGALAIIQVADTLKALQQLAGYNRERSGVRLVGVTGSTGKTTTKDLTAAVLSARYNVLATRENLNNEIGLSLTLLALESHHEVAVCELAMRAAGEIDALSRIARPDAGVITNIGETHLELLGTVANIARAKGELLDHIPRGGFAVLHVDSPYMREQAQRCRGRLIFFGEGADADIKLVRYQPEGNSSRLTAYISGKEVNFFLPLPGRHNAINALAAIGVGLEMGLGIEEIAKGLAAATLSPMRLNIVECGSLTIINDVYNASPASMRAALAVLREVGRNRSRVAVLGNMLELGPRAVPGHREVGEVCAATGLRLLVTVGDLAREIACSARAAGVTAVYECANNREAVTLLTRLLQGDEVILVKGSRGVRMEEIVDALKSIAASGGPGS